MSVLPAPTAVARPVFDTVAAPVLVDDHVAEFETFCVVPFDRFAVAENCTVPPTATEGEAPATVTLLTVGDGGVPGSSLHAVTNTAATMHVIILCIPIAPVATL